VQRADQKAESEEQRAESREQRAERREQKADSRDQGAESREQRADQRTGTVKTKGDRPVIPTMGGVVLSENVTLVVHKRQETRLMMQMREASARGNKREGRG
jgi:hypothetical protein